MKSMSGIVYGLFLILAAQINPDIKNTEHYKKVQGIPDYLELNEVELEKIGFYIFDDIVNYPVFEKESRRTFQIMNGDFRTNTDTYKDAKERNRQKYQKSYYPMVILDDHYKVLYANEDAKNEKLLPVLVPARTSSGYSYYLYLFLYTDELKQDLPEDFNPDKYIRKLKDIRTL